MPGCGEPAAAEITSNWSVYRAADKVRDQNNPESNCWMRMEYRIYDLITVPGGREDLPS